MGLLIYCESPPPEERKPKTNTDPTAYDRSIIRRNVTRERRSRHIFHDPPGSAARAVTGERQQLARTLHRTRSTYGTDGTFDELWLPPIQPELGGDASSPSRRPRSRRGPVTSTSHNADEDLFPPLRRMTGRSPLRNPQWSSGPRPTFPPVFPTINGLGDRERSVSADPPDWSSARNPPAGTPVEPQVSVQPPGSPLPVVVGAGDSESLFCDDAPDHVAVSNARNEPADINRHRQAVNMLHEAVGLADILDNRLGDFNWLQSHNDDVLAILRQLEDLAERLRLHEQTLISSIRRLRQEREAREARARAQEGRSELGLELGRL